MKIWSWAIALAFVCLFAAVMPGVAESRITEISADSAVSMALNDNGTVWARGTPYYIGCDTVDGLQPVIVPGMDHVMATSNYMGPVILKDDGTVWVLKYYPLARNASRPESSTYYKGPVKADALSDVIAISGTKAGGNGVNLLALKSDGTVWAMGDNMYGQLGIDDGMGRPSTMAEFLSLNPVRVKVVSDIKAISMGSAHAMALKKDGTVWSWGMNDMGQLGDSTVIQHPYSEEDGQSTPVMAKGLANVTAIAAGNEFSLALADDGTVWAWGRDDGGQLGDGLYSRDGKAIFRSLAGKVSFSTAFSGPAIRPSWMVSPRPPVRVSLPVPDDSSIEYMAAIGNAIYAFSANGLVAMDGSGVPLWNISIPGTWTYENAYGLIANANRTSVSYMTGSNIPEPIAKIQYDTDWRSVKMVPTFDAEGGHVYIYALANRSDSMYSPSPYQNTNRLSSLSTPTKYAEKTLIVVSPDGKVEWSRSFTDNIAVQDRSHVEAYNGRIYLYHDYNESVFDTSGNLLFTINNIADPASVDESGCIYAMPAVRERLASTPTAQDGEYFDYRIPSNIVEKYGPDGQLVWQKELPEKAIQPYFAPTVWNDNIGIPLYMNGLLYVPVQNGTMALNKDGAPVWTKKLDDAYGFYYLMPADSGGNLYLYVQHSYDRYHDSNITVVGITPDGSELGRADIGPGDAYAASDGVLYLDAQTWDERYHPAKVTLDNMQTAKITAYDLKEGKYIWEFTTPIGETSTVTVNKSNIYTLIPDYLTRGIFVGSIMGGHSYGQIIPSGDLTYISYRIAVWDEPIVYDCSTYTYFSTLYALDRDGKLVWQKPMGSFVTAAAANNSTIYYGTNGGGISVSIIGVVAGLAIVASVLLFLKFFALGSVTRARSKIDKNDNRNRVHRFIAEYPGSTLYEMSKELGMNIGTLRYHLMILGLNHRIVAYNDDSKFVRYFTNSNTYSNEDKLIISLVRRESMGRLLKAILEESEATNGELCVRLGLPESGISKYLGELSDKGVVTKTGQGTRMYYSIRELHRERLSKAIALIDNGITTVKKGNTLPDKAGTSVRYDKFSLVLNLSI